MTESELLEVFRRALRASLAVPLVAGMASCSSSSSASRPDVGAPPDGSKADAGIDTGHRADSGTGDAAHRDAGRDVAKIDAGNPCTFPGGTPCMVNLPLFCFDGGLSADAQPTPELCTADCPAGWGSNCAVAPGFDGGPGYSVPTSLACANPAYCNGRAYAGMARPSAPGQQSAVGRYFAASAELEAASIDAFRILRDELRAHDAPEPLIDAAIAAGHDEVRHARMTRKLARRYGPVVAHRRAPARPVRPLDVVAEENAVEGCVRETYAALLAHHQAAAARDPDVKTAMTRIAADETRHAALAWHVAAWAEARLDPHANARVRAARATAVRELREGMARKVPVPLTKVAGIPPADAAMRMLRVLEAELWTTGE